MAGVAVVAGDDYVVGDGDGDDVDDDDDGDDNSATSVTSKSIVYSAGWKRLTLRTR